MTPMPTNPVVVLMVVDGQVRATASNIDPEMTVKVVDNAAAFERESLGVTFNSTRPVPKSNWVAASKKS